MIQKQLKSNGTSMSLVIIMFAFLTMNVSAQSVKSSFPLDTLMKAAREIIKANPYCALVTIDSTGLPQVRTMNPFPLGDEMVIWFATSRKSRKLSHIRKNPNVCVYYADHNKAKGYVNITGTAVIIDDKELLVKMKRAYWENIPDWQNKFVLLKITPKTMDVINYAHGINEEPGANRSPTIVF
jgi:general stress protein 26